MSDNSQKTHFAQELNRFAAQKALSVMERIGRNLPCKVKSVMGSIVTVTFELQSKYTLDPVTMPYFGPEYIRYPVQVGDLGVTVAIDTYMGGISGLGGGTADLRPVSNLSALFFMPVASTNWSMTDDPNAVVIYGPDGAVIRTVDKTAALTVKGGSSGFHGPFSFDALVTMTADLVVNMITQSTHVHEVSADPGLTGPPRNP
jgi:hypothetical protein